MLAYMLTITNVILWFPALLHPHFQSFSQDVLHFFCHQKVFCSPSIKPQALEILQNNNYIESHIVSSLLSILLSSNALILAGMLDSHVNAV